MPTYSYRCKTCGHCVDARRSIINRNVGPVCRHATMAEGGNGLHLVPSPSRMVRVIDPVPGIVRNPAAGPRKGR